MGYADQIGRVDRTACKLLGGEPVIYQPAAGPPVPLTGIFDEHYVLQAADGAGVGAVAPAVFLQRADLPVDPELIDPELDGPTLTIRGIDYRMDHPETAGMGSVVLVLRKVI